METRPEIGFGHRAGRPRLILYLDTSAFIMLYVAEPGVDRVREAVFERDWRAMAITTPDERMIRRAGDHAERFGLRGDDSVHLAAAESLVLDDRYPVHFASFDGSLNEAAGRLGLQTLSG